ncbi:MAG TPA: DUF2244 domain-containing protein [Rhodopila sp.]|uniref:DUF2244 domain-containing protein n=1 Tax=Rhodopila sp. TaxID=2480087 RepID=UPI002C8A6A05|nr:DUF2244 domain-containing protein [Rhodopila sp.]HVY17065.1 DUF2244 domain-containing protein [Rhodopila sp.]
MTADSPETQQTIFEASIVPYRSLGRKGVFVLVGVLTVLVTLIITRVLLIGAWPVALFSGVEVPLLILLLWLNMRARRISEMIIVTARDVTVTRTDWTGRRSTFQMPAGWLRVDRQLTAGASRLLLRAHGTEREVGGFLHEADRESLYRGLRDALHSIRNPSFDNPQLRDD